MPFYIHNIELKRSCYTLVYTRCMSRDNIEGSSLILHFVI